MKRFVKNIVLFLVIPIIILFFFSFEINPYYGNKYYNTKFDYFHKNIEKYNTVFLGSSRIYRQINTPLLDSLMYQYNFSTFNLATPATYNPEIYYLYAKFLGNIKPNTILYAFIELQPLNKIAKKNINTTRNYYWMNLKYLFFSYNYLFNADYLDNQKYQIKVYTKSFINKLFDFKKYKYIFIKENSDKKIIGKQGYYSLNQHMNDIGGENGFCNRFSNFMNDTSVLQKRKIATIQVNKSYNQKLNKAHLEKLKRIINLSGEKGIHVFL